MVATPLRKEESTATDASYIRWLNVEPMIAMPPRPKEFSSCKNHSAAVTGNFHLFCRSSLSIFASDAPTDKQLIDVAGDRATLLAVAIRARVVGLTPISRVANMVNRCSKAGCKRQQRNTGALRTYQHFKKLPMQLFCVPYAKEIGFLLQCEFVNEAVKRCTTNPIGGI